MTLSAGSRLGPYEVAAPLGAGGMGEVYRAKDAKLGRDVAIKVLPPDVADDAERLARFEREARLLAALNHPNVAHVYGFESAAQPDGSAVHFLAMELVEGEDLAERLKRGPIPVEEALDIARQIAEALEEAHEKGIVHRDLKPANVKVAPEGKVKVLDFGLAKAYAGETASGAAAGGSGDLSQSPTRAHTGTQAGMILGTAGYMSPEQARGKPVDRRADIWAFGVVLYEMLTGRRLFEGETVSDVLASVLRQEVDWTALPPAVPAELRRLLARCLERNPKNRLHDAADARLVLADLERGEKDATASAAAAPARRSRSEVVAWALALLFAGGAGLLAWSRGPQRAVAPRVIRSILPMPPGLSLELDGERSGMPALSPDGRQVAFGAREGAGPMRIWLQDLSTARTRALPGTEGGYRPFWSPDGRNVGFFTWGHLATTPAEGGAVTLLAPARDSRGGTWSPNGTIVYAPFAFGPLLSISERGGPARPATTLPEGAGSGTHRFPQLLPDGESFLYLERLARAGSGKGSGVRVGRLGTTVAAARLLDGATNAVYSDGRLLFVRGGALVAQPFDPKRLALSGEPTVLVSDILFNERFSYGVFSASEAGILAFLTGRQTDLCQLVWRDRSGKRVGELGTPGTISGFGGLALSRDGRWAAASRVGEGASDADIWIYDLSRGTETRLARPGSDEFDPVFTPDGDSMTFGTTSDRATAVVRRDLARGEETVLHEQPPGRDLAPMSYSPDGAWLTCDKRSNTAQADLVLLPAAGAAEPRVLVATPVDDAFGQVSPDGRWLAWASEESGRYEVYVDAFPGGGARVQVSRSGGIQPRWNPAGGELFFKAPDNMLMAVPVATGSGTVSVGTPVPLFQIPEFYGWTYAVSADGKRFLVREPLVEREASPITLLTDWTSLVARR